MNISILDLVTTLESDVANFYRKMLTLNRFGKSRPLFQAMVKESSEHELKNRELLRQQTVPGELDVRAVLAFQARVKDALFKELSAEKNPLVIFRAMADGESLLATLYRKLAEVFAAGTAAQQPLAEEFRALAAEEDQHRERLLAELRQYAENVSLDDLIADSKDRK